VGFGIVLLGMVVGVMVAQPNIDEAMDDLKEARADYSAELLGVRNTQFDLEGATYNSTTGMVVVVLMNTGTTVIGASEIDVLVDGVVTSPTTGPALWVYPGSSSEIALKSQSKPASLVVVGPYGISRMIGGGSITSV
jgi:archaellum component FlaF (FlaF/FlaG flagellin family)